MIEEKLDAIFVAVSFTVGNIIGAGITYLIVGQSAEVVLCVWAGAMTMLWIERYIS